MENEELAARAGLLQRLDPRVKLVSLVLFAVAVSLVHAIWALVAFVVVTVVLAAASRVPVLSFVRKVWLSAGLLAFLIALPSALAWFTPGQSRRVGRSLHLHRAGTSGRGHAGHPRRGRRGLRSPHHLDDALVRPAPCPERPPHARSRGRHPGHDAEADPDASADGRADPPRPREPHADPRHDEGEPGLGDGAHGVRRAQVTEDGRRCVRRDALARLHRRDAVAQAAAGRPRRLAVADRERRAVRGRARRRPDRPRRDDARLRPPLGRSRLPFRRTGALRDRPHRGARPARRHRRRQRLRQVHAAQDARRPRLPHGGTRSSPSARRSRRRRSRIRRSAATSAPRVGFVFQDADVQLFCASVLDELAFGPLQLGLPEDEVRRRVRDVGRAPAHREAARPASLLALRRREEARRHRLRDHHGAARPAARRADQRPRPAQPGVAARRARGVEAGGTHRGHGDARPLSRRGGGRSTRRPLRRPHRG